MEQEIAALIIKLSDEGPNPVLAEMESMVDQEESEMMLIRLGAQYISLLGQAESRYTGLYGPVPVHTKDDWLSFLYGFEIQDTSLQDERLQQQAYCILSIFFPRGSEFQWAFSRFAIENFLNSLFQNINSVQELESKPNFLTEEVLLPLQSIQGGAEISTIEEKPQDETIDKTRIQQVIEQIQTLKLSKRFKWGVLNHYMLPNQIFDMMTSYFFAAIEKKEGKVLTFVGNKFTLAFTDFEESTFLDAQKDLPKKTNGFIIAIPFKSDLIKYILTNIPKFLKKYERNPVAICLIGMIKDVYEEAVAELSANLPNELLHRPFSFFNLCGPNDVLTILDWILQRTKMDE